MPNWTIPTTYDEIWSYANNLGVPKESVTAWINANGAYPNNLDTFVAWATAAGYRNADGGWNWRFWELRHNTPVLLPQYLRAGAGTNPLGGTPILPGQTTTPTTPGTQTPGNTTPGGTSTQNTVKKLETFIKAHPLESIGIAAGVAYLMSGKRRR